MAKTTGLASISEGRSDLFKIDPRKIEIKEGWNSRDMADPENIAHVDMLAQSIVEIGVREPITVNWEGGKAYVTDGHCRLLATMRAINQYKAEIKTIMVKTEDRYSNEADRVFSQIVRNNGKPFSAMEKAKVYKKLIDMGWQQGDIAKKEGVTSGRVSQILGLLTLPEPIKQMVVAGQVSPTMAVQTVRASGGDGTKAEQDLKAGLAVAAETGKGKVTATFMPAGEKINIKSAMQEAFEFADIDDSDEEVIVVKFPADKWAIVSKILEL